MKAITKFYSNGREVDIVESVKATILESAAPFTAQDVYECLSAANPTDEYLSEDSVRRACRMFCNPMSPFKSQFLMNEIEEGVYLQHGVEVKASQSIADEIQSIIDEEKANAAVEASKPAARTIADEVQEIIESEKSRESEEAAAGVEYRAEWHGTNGWSSLYNGSSLLEAERAKAEYLASHPKGEVQITRRVITQEMRDAWAASKAWWNGLSNEDKDFLGR